MRILHVSSAKTFGGGERHLVDLCRELVNRGHEVFVALRPTNEWQERLDFLLPESFMHVSIRNSFGMFSAKRIAAFIEKEQINVVHAHLARDYLATSIACRGSKNAKLVLTRHVASGLKPFHRFALRNVAAAIAVSGTIRDQLERIFSADKIYVIPNGVDIGQSTADNPQEQAGGFRSLHNIPSDAPLVVTVGELNVGKGQRDLVLAANEIVKEIPDCRFVIAGKDSSIDQKFRRELRRLVRVLGHEDRFLWLDQLEDVSPLVSAADILVSPSHEDSMDMAILDAMVTGKAVVATETDSVRGLIPTDALVPFQDPLALAEKICWFLRNDVVRLELGQRLKANAGEMFGLERMVDATEKVYRAILNL